MAIPSGEHTPINAAHLILGAQSGWRDTYRRVPVWYGQALGQIAQILQEKKPLYASSAIAGDSAEIIVFTDALVVRSLVKQIDADAGDVETKAWKRSSLVGLSVRGCKSLTQRDERSWPGERELILDYGDHAELTIPVPDANSDRDWSEWENLDKFTEVLLKDLG